MPDLAKKLLVVLALSFTLCANLSCSDSGISPNGRFSFNNKMGPGASATSFLRADRFTRLVIEVDYMPGYKPESQALQYLQAFLQRRLHKSQISMLAPSQIASGGQQAYSPDDVRKLETKNRDHFTGEDNSTLYAYLIITDGKDSEKDDVVGFAYYNTSVAFFGQTIDNISSGFGSLLKEKVEGTAFDHEFGHLMGLVDNGTPMLTDHKTDDSPHCTTEGCLMRPTIETGAFFDGLFNDEIHGLDSLCIQDLQANGGK